PGGARRTRRHSRRRAEGHRAPSRSRRCAEVQQGVPGVLHRAVPGAHHRRLRAGEHPGGDRSGGADPGLIGPCRERRGPRRVRAWRRGRPTGRPLPARRERCGRAPGASGALAALATGLARIRRIGLTEAARALLTTLLGLLLGVVPVAELSGIVLISHHGTPFLVTGPWAGRAICSWP